MKRLQQAIPPGLTRSDELAAVYKRTIIHKTEDDLRSTVTLVRWCGPAASWSRTVAEDEGGFMPFADGWLCGTGFQEGRSGLVLLKGDRRVFVPTRGDVVNHAPIWVH